MPILVSSNWASWLIAIFVFVISIVQQFRSREGKLQRFSAWFSEQWRKGIGFAVLASVVVYGVGLFLWSTWQTVYDDHHDSTGRWQAVVKERNNLYAQVVQQESQIRQLQSRSCPTCPSRPSQGTPVQQAETIHEFVAEARVTCQLRDSKRLPVDLAWKLPSEDSYLQGPTKTYVRSRAERFKRTEEEGEATAIEEFKPSDNSDLIGMPVTSLSNFTMFHLAMTSVNKKSFTTCTYAELTFRANGRDVFRMSSPMSVQLSEGGEIVADIALHDWKLNP